MGFKIKALSTIAVGTALGSLYGGFGPYTGGITTLGFGALMFIQALSGGWPYIRNDDTAYWPTQTIFGQRDRILKPRMTSLLIRPFEKRKKDKDGKFESIDETDSEQVMKFHATSIDAFEFDMDVQYRWVVRDPFKYVWIVQQPRVEKLDEMVAGALQDQIGAIKGLVVARGLYIEKAREYLNTEEEPRSIRNRYGVEILGIRVINPNPTRESHEILTTVARAKFQARETRIMARATRKSISDYEEAAERIKQAGSMLPKGDIMRELIQNDNREKQVTASKNATVVNLGGGIPMYQVNPSQQIPISNPATPTKGTTSGLEDKIDTDDGIYKLRDD
ncbi:MAG: hypothetical protein AABW46_00160 [Nanoarchaeota archaeon]